MHIKQEGSAINENRQLDLDREKIYSRIKGSPRAGQTEDKSMHILSFVLCLSLILLTTVGLAACGSGQQNETSNSKMEAASFTAHENKASNQKSTSSEKSSSAATTAKPTATSTDQEDSCGLSEGSLGETKAGESSPEPNSSSGTRPGETGSQETEDTASLSTSKESLKISRKYDEISFTIQDPEGEDFAFEAKSLTKPTIIHFWAEFCPICVKELPELESFWQAQQENIDLYAIDLAGMTDREDINKAKALIQDKGYTFPCYYDTSLEAALLFGLKRLPYTVVLSPEGQVLEEYSGSSDFDHLAEIIK